MQALKQKAERSRAAAVPPRLAAVAPLDIAERTELRRALRNSAKLGGRGRDLLCRFLLAEVVNSVLGSLSLDELLERLIDLASRTLDAERGTIFLHDVERDELFSRVAQGDEVGEIRIPRNTGIAGAVFDSGTPEIVHDPYGDPRFNPTVDQRTGYHTGSLICAPLQDDVGAVIGVVEILNKRHGRFDRVDLMLLQAIAGQAATALEHARVFDEQKRERAQDLKLLELTESVSLDLHLDGLLARIVEASAELLDAERATLFVHDPATSELWSRMTGGAKIEEIRIPADLGIAGSAFTSAQVLNIPDAYADPRFNQQIDARTGYRTRNLLCMPITDQHGTATGVLEVLNKRVGRFTGADERRLRVFGTQAAIALQNAQLFTDVLALKNYTDGILRTLSDGVVTLDRQFGIVSVNDAARRILHVAPEQPLTGPADRVWGAANPWLVEALGFVAATGGTDHRADLAFTLENGEIAHVNVTVAPLRDGNGAPAGVTMVLEDIGAEKKVRSTMTRYMAKEFAEHVLTSGGEATAGSTHVATVLFSDIRRFTTLSEAMTPRATVEMLNEYFAVMAEIVQQHQGVLDKYIGDAVMAVFGAPTSGVDDADNAVTAATQMICRLRQLNLRRANRGAMPLEIGIGLASGELVAGPIGSAKRMDYTVIGDSVNLASRLESANKQYGTGILISGATVERLASSVRMRRIDLIRVKGKENPTEIYEVVDHHSEESFPGIDEVLPCFESGITRYRERDWSGALTHFSAALKIFPKDGPSWVYTDRCLYYRDHPPPAHWDGIWTMKSK
jgi:adenylate cyclase